MKPHLHLEFRGCRIGIQGPQLCAKSRHFRKLDVTTSRMAFLDINLNQNISEFQAEGLGFRNFAWLGENPSYAPAE